MSREKRMKTIMNAMALVVLGGLAASPVAAQGADVMADLPQDAKAGECYARVLVPASYNTETERVLKSEASERIEILPARYEWVEERVLVKEASTRIEVVPAKYSWAEERVEVASASMRKSEVPARYEWVEERILVKPAQTVWKKGRGPVEKVDNGTGEIMCLVEEPAVYRTMRKQVLAAPPKTIDEDIPAEFKTVKKQVLVEPASTRTLEIPAEYTTVRVRRMVSPPTEKRVAIPAVYETVSRQVMVSEPRVEWRSILCETNMGTVMVSDIQRALKNAGFDPGPIDGVFGTQTMRAVTAYQRSKGMAEGALTFDALKSLGISTN